MAKLVVVGALLLSVPGGLVAQKRFASAVAEVSIGDPQGAGPTVFGRVADAKLDSRRRIVVLDELAGEVRIFDAKGAFVHRFGRPGRGPGELGRVTDLLIGAGDTLFVPDPGQARINVFTDAGQLVRTVTFRPQPMGKSWQLDAGGDFFFRGTTISRSADGRFEIGDGLYRRSSSGERLDTLTTFAYPKTDIGGPGKPIAPVIVNGAIWARFADGRIAWSSLDRDRVLISANGRVDSLGHPSWKAAPLTSADQRAFRDLFRAKLQLLGGDVTAADGSMVTFPGRLPAITGLRAAPDGNLWVQAMGSIAGAEPMAINATERSEWLGGSIWYVFGPDRAFLGTVTLPPRTRVTEVGRGYLLAIRRDDQDVESVVKFRLDRP